MLNILSELLVLPDGTSVDPLRVMAIVPVERSTCELTGTFPDRVIVHANLSFPTQFVFNCESQEEAQSLATELREKVNVARIL